MAPRWGRSRSSDEPPVVDPEFVEFVAARSAALFRTAVLITGDRYAAADCARPQLYWDQATLTSKGLEFICNVDHSKALLVPHSDAVVSEVVGAQALQGMTSTGTSTDEWQVGMTLSAAGTRHFAEITTVAYNDGGAIAVVVDGVSYVEPTVTQGPITGGQAQITGNLTERRAKLLAAVVGGGTLPSDFRMNGATESK